MRRHWVHLLETDGLISMVQAPGFLAPHRYSLEGMTSQSKGLGLAILPLTLFGTKSIIFIIELRVRTRQRAYSVKTVKQRRAARISKLLGISVDVTIVMQFCAYLVN
jgi:hypothetical protein